ncbi:uncharacterized protein LOC119769121 [Culex quinquefasciatus]|uniref:uncharacterized protein LOC119769121 n=1 Tax=Culex quinquefasciatus TaxID=7176 RepID=UPI0018E32951|nr:uncharacterized protein LOC119769121 [Culex quinquefasciatus]
MASNPRKPFVRQTRSMTRAAQEAANLQIGDAQDDAAKPFEPSVVEPERGDEQDCAGCTRPNNAELYMVRCEKCELYFHFSCANVTTATVNQPPFVCRTCVPFRPRSTRSSGSHVSSTRSARIALELQQMEEQFRIQEALTKERLAQLERQYLYSSKKYALLREQEEDGGRSVRSRDSRASTSRVEKWINAQAETGNTGPGVNKETTESDDHVQPLSEDKADSLHVKFTSTPLASPNASFNESPYVSLSISSLLPDSLEESSEKSIPEGPKDPGQTAAEIPPSEVPEPPTTMESMLKLLQISLGKPQNTGAIPKILKVTSTAFEEWRNSMQRKDLDPIPEELSEETKKNEQNLLVLLQQLEDQRAEDQQLQRQRKSSSNASCSSKNQVEAEQKEEMQRLLQQQQRELAEQKRELKQRLKEQKQQQAKQQEELDRLRELERLQKLAESRDKNHSSAAGRNGTVDKSRSTESTTGTTSVPRVDDDLPPPSNERSRASANFGSSSVRSSRSSSSRSSTLTTPSVVPSVESFPSLVPPLPAPPPYQGPTSQQIAARQVVNKELPVFTGNPVDWPIFISSYNHSTLTCGYTDNENLLRLQRAIQGRAREEVSSLLLNPSTIPQLLTSLKLLYGRPEQIVHTMIEKVRATPAPRADKLESLVSFGLVVHNLCGHLKAIGMEKHLSNPILLHELVAKLPSNVMFNWALYQEQLPVVDLNVFGDYMSKIATATSGVTLFAAKAAKDDFRPKKEKAAYVNTHSTAEQGQRKGDDEIKEKPTDRPSSNIKVCPMCDNSGHLAANCSKFSKLCLDDRWKLVKEKRLCRRCLVAHSRWPCKSDPCGVQGCQKKHHPLLHYEQAPTEAKRSEPATSGVVALHRQPTISTLFRMLPVTLYGKKGKVNTFAFLDDGSSVTLLERKLAATLGLEGKQASLCIHWTSGIKKNFSETREVELEISGADRPQRFVASNVYTVDKLGLPEQTMDVAAMAEEFAYLQDLPLLSLQSAVPGILIGLNNVHLLATLKLREGRKGEPIATKTRLGWTVYGSMPAATQSFAHRQFHISDEQAEVDLHEYVKSFFAVESLGVMAVPSEESVDDQRANKILSETTKRDYVEFPDSRPMAEKRMKCLERRLGRDPALYDQVRKQIADFQSKGFAHKATAAELDTFDPRRTWYLPLGVVLNPKKPGKVRVIWDAAAKVDGVSLNTMLLKGPDLLTPLLSVLFQFRERQVAICADIEAMFHQVKIREPDRSAQLFLWRDSPDKPLETMVTDVAIFGATCSPAHSQYVKNLNANEHEADHPKAAAAIRNKHYVDDYLDSVDTADEAVAMALEVAEVHAKAGFHIRNWISNDKTVLARIGAVNPTTVKNFVIEKENGFERLLGMVWLPDEDMFSFALSLREDNMKLLTGEVAPTKTQLLSIVMSIYDPNGLVAVFVIHGKILVQDVWRSGVGWKDKIPEKLIGRWKQWIALLRKIETVRVPRCYFKDYEPASLKTLQLHMFVDASEQAYSAMAYFRLEDRGQVRCSLVATKTKVAPLQPLPIPRLEVQSGVTGSRLRKTIEDGHSLPISKVVFWSDSKTALQWIRSTDLRRFRPYVAFRVNEILSLSKAAEWRYCPSRMNVADEATKWGKKGPTFDPDAQVYVCHKFIYDQEEDWPEDCLERVEATEELRSAFMFSHFVVMPIIRLELFSRWERLLRMVAYVHRFLARRLKLKQETCPGALTREELQKAERSLWRLAQSDAYPDEVATLNQNLLVPAEKRECLETSSSILKLSPLLDDSGVLRAGSRLEAAEFAAFDAKFPVILPNKHRVTWLLVDSYHRRFRHANNETVVNEIRQKFNIPKLRVLIRQVANKCCFCRIKKAIAVAPMMAPLPRVRLSPFVRPFTFTGVDYFGPVLIKVGRSAAKRWVALFTCLTIRAVHLELVASLSTDSCKKAIRRFIARRGAPQEIYSDNGTNFQGASGELLKELAKVNHNELSSTFTDIHTQWRFNPPAAPHMGGCWERMVRSVKAALGVIPVERKLDEESLVTLLAEAEHMVNSRPLTFVPLESADSESLTPNHFLMLSSSGVQQAVKDRVGVGAAIKNSWNSIQHALDEFWCHWVKEYLPTIARRTKWFEEVRPIKEGDIVLVVDEGHRNGWLRGRVARTYPGKDGRTSPTHW